MPCTGLQVSPRAALILPLSPSVWEHSLPAQFVSLSMSLRSWLSGLCLPVCLYQCQSVSVTSHTSHNLVTAVPLESGRDFSVCSLERTSGPGCDFSPCNVEL